MGGAANGIIGVSYIHTPCSNKEVGNSLLEHIEKAVRAGTAVMGDVYL